MNDARGQDYPQIMKENSWNDSDVDRLFGWSGFGGEGWVDRVGNPFPQPLPPPPILSHPPLKPPTTSYAIPTVISLSPLIPLHGGTRSGGDSVGWLEGEREG